MPESPAFTSHHNPPSLQAVLHGLAVGQFADWSVREHLRAGRLHAVLADQDPVLDWHLFVYRPHRHQQTARVKRVYDALAQALHAFFTG